MENDKSNLYISDEDYANLSKYEEYATSAQELIDDLFKTMQDIVDENALQGKAADNLSAFAEMAKGLLAKDLSSNTIFWKQEMNKYIGDIDYADSVFYE